MNNPPSPRQIELAMTTFLSAKQRLEESNDDDLIDASRELWIIEGKIEDSLRRILAAIIENDYLADAAKARIETIRQRQERFRKKSESLRGVAFAIMDALEMRRIVDPEFTASIRSGSDSVVITDETQIPDEYWRVERKIDKAKLNADVKVGVVIPGAELRNAMPSLAIRTK